MKKQLFGFIVAALMATTQVRAAMVETVTNSISQASTALTNFVTDKRVVTGAVVAGAVAGSVFAEKVLAQVAEPFRDVIISVSDFVHNCVNNTTNLFLDWNGERNATKRHIAVSAGTLAIYFLAKKQFPQYIF